MSGRDREGAPRVWGETRVLLNSDGAWEYSPIASTGQGDLMLSLWLRHYPPGHPYATAKRFPRVDVRVHPPAMLGAGNGGSWSVCR